MFCIKTGSRFFKDECGTIVITATIAIAILMGAAGAALDFGYWHLRRTKMQNLADTASTAAVLKFSENGSVDEAYATAKGILDSSRDLKGLYSIDTDPSTARVSVRISETGPRFLSHVLHRGDTRIAVRSDATSEMSKTPGKARLCVLAINANASSGFKFHGNGNLNAPDCIMWSNSKGKGSIEISQAVNVAASSICAVGEASNSSSGTVFPAPRSFCPVQTDPYAAVVVPIPDSCDYTKFSSNAPIVHLVPGTYCKGIDISSDTVIAAPGIYHIKGGQVTIKGLSDVRMEGVTLYLSGPGVGLSVSGNSLLRITAPVSGPTQNVALAVDPDATGQKTIAFSGSSFIYIDGIVHAPDQRILMSGNSTGSVELSNAMLVGGDIEFGGAATWRWSSVDRLPPSDYGPAHVRLVR